MGSVHHYTSTNLHRLHSPRRYVRCRHLVVLRFSHVSTKDRVSQLRDSKDYHRGRSRRPRRHYHNGRLPPTMQIFYSQNSMQILWLKFYAKIFGPNSMQRFLAQILWKDFGHKILCIILLISNFFTNVFHLPYCTQKSHHQKPLKVR